MKFSNKTVLVLGGDQRLLYLARMLKEHFSHVRAYALDGSDTLHGIQRPASLEEAMAGAHVIVTPVPFAKEGKYLLTKEGTEILLSEFISNLKEDTILFGGNISPSVWEAAKEKNVTCFDFMKMERVAVKNAITTAEGAIAEAITMSTQNINQEECLVLGYGRCAKAIAQRLRGFDAKVTIAARKETARLEAEAQGYGGISLEELACMLPKAQFIFNTIPSMVLNEESISLVHSDAVILDIASAPGGTDFEACREKGIQAKLSLGIPGRFSPKTSASILLGNILSSLQAD